MIKTIIADGLEISAIEKLAEITKLNPKTNFTRDELLKEIPQTEILIIRSATQVNTELLKKAKNLKLIIRAGEGTDNIDKTACEELGIDYKNTPGANNNSAAEHAIALIFDSLRKVSKANAQMKAGIWDKSSNIGSELAHKKVGVVGLGKIGQIVAKRLKAFDCNVAYFDPFVDDDNYTKIETLEELVANSKIITIHLPLIEATKGIFNAQLFGTVNTGAILVNASRGGIVDESALKSALDSGLLSHAALDVYETEPLKNNIFKDLDNITLTPHLGASTKEAQQRVGKMVVEIIENYIK